jgi:hypothetical protein
VERLSISSPPPSHYALFDAGRSRNNTLSATSSLLILLTKNSERWVEAHYFHIFELIFKIPDSQML